MELRILAVADIHSPDDFTLPEIDPGQVDLVVTLGDISAEIVDYILYMARKVKVLGVLGNQDPKEVPGLEDHHGEVIAIGGIRFGFLKGAPRSERAPNHFTERQMARVVRKMGPAEVIVSHAPPRCTSRSADSLHQGFEAFDGYLRRHHPRYWIHGHLERSSTQEVEGTRVIGVRGKELLRLSFEGEAASAGPAPLRSAPSPAP